MTVEVLLLRMDAPIVSFGAPIVDNLGVIQPFPGLSMLTGLFANALGWEHGDFDRLEDLQSRLRYAARCDRPGKLITDYQIVQFGNKTQQDDETGVMDDMTAWTTRGRLDRRRGGDAAKTGSRQRYRDYWADSVHTIAVAVSGEGSHPTAADLAEALREPARPLFLGRKCCLPSTPLFLGLVQAPSPLAALARLPRIPVGRAASDAEPLSAWWLAEEQGDWVPAESRLLVVVDERDWPNQIHGGERRMREGLIDPPAAGEGG